jgi:hypothetical protein
MSYEWTRADRDGFCGGCGESFVSGDQIRLTSVIGVTRRFVRCATCAGGAPPELPADVAPPAPARDGFAPLQSVRPTTRGELRRMSGSVLRAVVND